MKIKVAGKMSELTARESADLVYRVLRSVRIPSVQELIELLEHHGFDLTGRNDRIELCHVLNLLVHENKVKPRFAIQIGSELGFRLEIEFIDPDPK